MAIGFPASHETTLPISGEIAVARERVAMALNALGWKFAHVGPDHFVADVSLNLASWGEKLTVTLAGGSITVRSTCSMPFQIIDWGKNEKNVGQFLARFF